MNKPILRKFQPGTFYTDLSPEEAWAFKNGNQSGILVFYMHGCGHCDRLKPVLHALAEKVAKEKKNLLILGIESDNMKPEWRNHVSGYPTIYLVNNGYTSKKFRGSRTVEAFWNEFFP